jgi:hypothetical protein
MDDDRPGRWRLLRMQLQIALLRLLRDLSIWSDIRAFPPLGMLAGLNCVAVLILMRQQSPGPSLRLTDLRLCAAALAACGLTIASRWLLARIEGRPPAFRIRALLAAIGAFPLIVLLSLATPRNSPWSISFVSLLAVAAGNANLLWNRGKSASRVAARRSRGLCTEKVSGTLPQVDDPVPDQNPKVPDTFFVQSPPGELLGAKPDIVRLAPTAAPALASMPDAGNEWTQRRCNQGQVQLRGRVHASFAARQSLASVHIPFVPAFGGIPEFTCQIIDQPDVRARAPAVYRYGARIELKRSGNANGPLEVEVEFRATSGDCLRAA